MVAEREPGTPTLPDYPYRKSILRDEDLFVAGAPLLDFMLQEPILRHVRDYLPFHPYLRSAEIWVDYASEDPALETQFFHLDGDDAYNLKVFVYLNDVSEENGPFTFMPTDRISAYRIFKPEGINRTARVRDEDVHRFGESVSFTGRRGSVILADTCLGYHKGLKPRKGRRVMFTFQFTSAEPYYGPVLPELPAGSPAARHRSHLLTRSGAGEPDARQ
jgi:hypothetical protein